MSDSTVDSAIERSNPTDSLTIDGTPEDLRRHGAEVADGTIRCAEQLHRAYTELRYLGVDRDHVAGLRGVTAAVARTLVELAELAGRAERDAWLAPRVQPSAEEVDRAREEVEGWRAEALVNLRTSFDLVYETAQEWLQNGGGGEEAREAHERIAARYLEAATSFRVLNGE